MRERTGRRLTGGAAGEPGRQGAYISLRHRNYVTDHGNMLRGCDVYSHLVTTYNGVINATSLPMAEVPHYPKGDLRRLLAVVAAIDRIRPATLVRIASCTGLDNRTVIHLIDKARSQAGIVITKTGTVYAIEDWGPVIRRTGAKLSLTGQVGSAQDNPPDRHPGA